MVKEPFSGLKIAIVGDFGSNWTKSRLSTFINNNGGEVVAPKTIGLTHLITTTKCFEEKNSAVNHAYRNKVFAVTFDWFEDSLQDRRKKHEARYDIARVSKEQRARKEKRARLRKANQNAGKIDYARSVSEAKEQFMTGGYETYVDPSGFSYDITLFRTDMRRNKTEKTILKLIQTHQEPHYFACSSTYVTQNGTCSTVIEAPHGSNFKKAFQAFQDCFKTKTFKHWDRRADTYPVLKQNGKVDERAYVWTPLDKTKIGMVGPFTLDFDGFLTTSFTQASKNPPIPRTVEMDTTATAETLAEEERTQEHDDSHQHPDESKNNHAAEDSRTSSAGFNDDDCSQQLRHGVIEQEWGRVTDSVAASERALDEQYGVDIETAQLKAALEQEEQSLLIEEMQHELEEPKVSLSKDNAPVPTGIVQGSWGGVTL